jgi:hypothetical protein
MNVLVVPYDIQLHISAVTCPSGFSARSQDPGVLSSLFLDCHAEAARLAYTHPHQQQCQVEPPFIHSFSRRQGPRPGLRPALPCLS